MFDSNTEEGRKTFLRNVAVLYHFDKGRYVPDFTRNADHTENVISHGVTDCALLMNSFYDNVEIIFCTAKLYLCLFKHHAMKMYREWRYKSMHS
jgi:hypothetical protein